MPKLSSFILWIPLVLGLVACAGEYDKRKEGEAREKQKAAKEAAAKKKPTYEYKIRQKAECTKLTTDAPTSDPAWANLVTVDYRVTDPKALNCDGSLKDAARDALVGYRFAQDIVQLPLASWPQGATIVTILNSHTCFERIVKPSDYNPATQKLAVSTTFVDAFAVLFLVIREGQNLLQLTFENDKGVVEKREMLLNYHDHNSVAAKALVASQKRCKDAGKAEKKKSN